MSDHSGLLLVGSFWGPVLISGVWPHKLQRLAESLQHEKRERLAHAHIFDLI